MALADIHTSFGAGELSKNLYARVDLDKYHVGAALVRNFFVDFRGGVSTRAGFQFIGRTKSSGTPALIPFSVSTTQTYVVELGELYARFYSNGAPIIDSTQNITGITQANPGVVTVGAIGAIANGRTVILSGITGMSQLNGRTFLVAGVAGSTFTLQNLDGTPINTSLYGAYISGGTVSLVYELSAPWHEADFFNPDGTLAIKFAQSADTMTLVHPLYAPQLLKRLTASTFSISPMVIKPVQARPTGLTISSSSGGSNAFECFCVTAVSNNGQEESLACDPVLIGHSDLNQIARLKWTVPAGPPPSYYKIYKQYNIGNSTFGLVKTSLANNAAIKENESPDFTKGPPQFIDPFTPSQPTGVNVTAGGAYGTSIPTVNFSGSSTGFAVLDSAGGGPVVAVALQYTDSDPGHIETISFSPGGATAVINSWTPASGTFPSCCTYFQQRQCFGASLNAPQNIWMSQSGNPFDFDQAIIPLDTDSLALGLASRQVNQIKSMVPMPSGCVLMTSGGAWLLSGGGQGIGVTPIDVLAQPQASSGANDIPPLVVNNDIIYVQSRGAVVRSLVFNFYVQSYFGTDRSLLANHLFFGYQLTSAAFAEEPFRLAYFTRSDGQLLCMTYVPEQEIYAWAHFDTNGIVKQVISVVEGQEDAVYVLVQRYVNGAWKNYIERLSSRNWQGQVEFVTALDGFLQLGQTKPAATLNLNGNSGTATASASSAVFAGNSSDIGLVVRGTFGGKAEVTGFINTTSCTVNIDEPFDTLTDDVTVLPMLSGQWLIAQPVSALQGLDHLAGRTVSALADGQVVTGLVVTADGFVTLPNPASYVTVGLPYQAQLQTLYLDLGEPTVQSKRKLLPQCEIRLDDTRGIKIGATAAQFAGAMDELPEQATIVTPNQLFTGDVMMTPGSDWTKEGQLCLQQDYPLPATVLGLIPQVLVGDTQR